MKRITNAEKKQIAEVLIEYLQNCEDGLDITTCELMRECGYEPGDFDEIDLMKIHDALFKTAGKAGLELDMSAHDGLFEGQPQYLDYIVYHHAGLVKCPRCGSNNIDHIRYNWSGLYEESRAKLEALAANGEQPGKPKPPRTQRKSFVMVGGELVDIRPKWVCEDCRKKFGKPPVLLSRDGETAEDYRDIVQEIRLTVGGFMPGWNTTIRKTDNGVKAERDEMLEFQHYEKELTNEEWETLLDDLYTKIYLHEWKKNYDAQCILDGEQWALSIKLTDGRVRNYHGSNDYPAYWDELLQIMDF